MTRRGKELAARGLLMVALKCYCCPAADVPLTYIKATLGYVHLCADCKRKYL